MDSAGQHLVVTPASVAANATERQHRSDTTVNDDWSTVHYHEDSVLFAAMPDLSTVFSTRDFIPHGHCYLWKPTLVWLHLVSDSLIALAYYSIPLSLVDFAKRRQDLPFKWVFWLFGAFIVTCGTTHLLDVWTLWHPTYWVSGALKALTALLSIATAVMLFRLLPAALQLPSPTQLEAANARLQAEIAEHERTEADLRKRKAALRDAQRIARLGNWEYDLQTQIITWSEELFRLFGLDPAMVAPPYEEELQLFAPASRVQLDQAVQAAAKDGTSYTLELQGIRVDGTMSWLVARGEAVSDATGDSVKLIGTIQDISDRKQAETLLELQSIVARNMAEGVCLVRAADGAIVYANPKFERLFGYAVGAMVGQHVSVVNYKDATTDPVDVHQSIMTTILQQGEATYEVQNVKQDGTPFWCQATTSMFEHPEYGTVLVAVQQEITERKQTETLIRASLKEKEVLLQEIHHRVKNNLQIVYSLLRLQRRTLKDPQAAAVLLESQNRIEAIALVHEKLYHAGDLAHIDNHAFTRLLLINRNFYASILARGDPTAPAGHGRRRRTCRCP